MSESQFLSRRELREAERNGLVNVAPVNFDAPAKVSESETTSVTRRQLRELERTGAVAPASSEAMRSVPEASAAVWAETEEPMTMPNHLFEVSPNLNVEPQTASIVIDHINDVTNFSAPIGDSGEMLKTGSIELPVLTVNTGEIAMVLGNEMVDRAIAEDSVAGFVSTIEPVPATGLIRAGDKINIVPSRANFDQSRVYFSLTISLFLVAAGGLVLGAYMLGFFR